MKNKILISELTNLIDNMIGEDYNPFIFDPNNLIQFDTEIISEREYTDCKKILITSSRDISSYRGYSLDSFHFVINLGGELKKGNYNRLTFQVLPNKDGVFRYVFPEKNKTIYKKFLSNDNLRTRLINKGIHLLNIFGLQSLIGGFNLSLSNVGDINDMINVNFDDINNIGFFMGTPGFDRKVVMVEKKNEEFEFTKLATSERAKTLIENEKKALAAIHSLNLTSFQYPVQLDNSKEQLTVNGPSSDATRTNEFQKGHYQFIEELFFATEHFDNNEKLSLLNDIKENLEIFRTKGNHKRYTTLVEYMLNVISNFEIKEFRLSSNHTDFTPWNTYLLNDNKLFIYDWELYRGKGIPLYDFIHFQMQSAIFLNGSSPIDTLNQIRRNSEKIEIQRILDLCGLTIHEAINLYIIKIASYTLATIALHTHITKDQNKMISFWNEALMLNFDNSAKFKLRTEFLINFQDFMRDKLYCALKFMDHEFNALKEESDLDLLIANKELNSIVDFSKSHFGVLKTVNKSFSFMNVLEIYFVDGGFLSIDLIYDFKRTSKRFMDAGKVLKNVKLNDKGVKVPQTIHDYEYSLNFYALNGSVIPLKYMGFFSELKGQTKELFGIEFKDSFENSIEMSKYATSNKLKLVSNLNLTKNYISDLLKRFKVNRGVIVTLSGVDGVGKSSIINEVHRSIEEIYRKDVVLLRHRPRILPILSSMKHGGVANAEKEAGIKKPRQGNNKNLLSSILRFSYYYLDYLLGNFYLRFKYLYRGKVIVFDRYYFDFIVDAKRSNIVLNDKLIKSLYRFVLKPELNILLWANTDDIYNRKPELSKDDIETLTKSYKKLFKTFDEKYKMQRYFIVENQSIKDTTRSILKEFVQLI